MVAQPSDVIMELAGKNDGGLVLKVIPAALPKYQLSVSCWACVLSEVISKVSVNSFFIGQCFFKNINYIGNRTDRKKSKARQGLLRNRKTLTVHKANIGEDYKITSNQEKV